MSPRAGYVPKTLDSVRKERGIPDSWRLAVLDCPHTVWFGYAIPEVDDLIYCPRCVGWRFVVEITHPQRKKRDQ